MRMETCTYRTNQQFEWTIGGFAGTKVDYVKQACNENGKLEMAITEEVSYGHSDEESFGSEVGASLEASIGVEFSGVSASVTAGLSTSVSQSLAQTWSSDVSNSKAVTIACDYYENDVKFNGGCMWQVKVTMRNLKYSENMVWIPKIIKCTSDETPPRCPPFYKCEDKNCINCIPLRQTAREKSKKATKKMYKVYYS